VPVCSDPTCPAAQPLDEFGRRISVQHGAVTQPVLGATGHHLLNRHIDGTLAAHLAAWTPRDLDRAAADITRELDRALAYVDALAATDQAIRAAHDHHPAKPRRLP
jgi:hypothetical protein